MNSKNKNQRKDLLKVDAKKLLSTDLMKIKGGKTAPLSLEADCTGCKNACNHNT
jgi:hypothetical protein